MIAQFPHEFMPTEQKDEKKSVPHQIQWNKSYTFGYKYGVQWFVGGCANGMHNFVVVVLVVVVVVVVVVVDIVIVVIHSTRRH